MRGTTKSSFKSMKKFGIKSPAELDDEEKKKFFNYVDVTIKEKTKRTNWVYKLQRKKTSL